MEVDDDSLDPEDVERARAFWAKEDVDEVFDIVFGYLDHLRRVLKKNTATDKEYVQGLKLLQSLDCSPATSGQDSSVVQVVIGSGELLVHDDSHCSPCYSPSTSPLAYSNGPSHSAAPLAGKEELLSPLTPVQLQYQLHTCCKACLAMLPIMPQSMPPFWGQNPLKIPLLCGFKRLTARPSLSPGGDEASEAEQGEPEGAQETEDWDVVYKAPCGLSLRNYEDVMRFLLATESYDILQVDFFTFNPSVRLDPPPSVGPQWPELDLSRGVEPTPVELCPGDGGARPPDFRYRKDRWPHGCFLSRGLTLFSTCCNCFDGCSDAQRCACVAMTRGGRHYSHHKLKESVPSGVYECGPWCGCDRARCQNRLVQRGIRVRLQVFQTDDCGWGVRCRDDIDRGTFVCMYAGVILQRVQSPTAPLSPKLSRTDLPSDDEVQVVTEWLVPSVEEGRSDVLEATKPPLHVPVIQRPSEAKTTPSQDRDEIVLPGGPLPACPCSSGDQTPAQGKTVAMTTPSPKVAGEMSAVGSGSGSKTEKRGPKSLKRAMVVEDVSILDASKEGNVSRFINHSCQPNLFLQNVFTDSHDPAFPVIAFFTSRVVKAGTELTWNYSTDTQRKQGVPCLCGSSCCKGHFAIEENLCDTCEAEGESQ